MFVGRVPIVPGDGFLSTILSADWDGFLSTDPIFIEIRYQFQSRLLSTNRISVQSIQFHRYPAMTSGSNSHLIQLGNMRQGLIVEFLIPR